MNAYERVMTTLNGGIPDCCPVVPMVREWCYAQTQHTLAQALDDPDIHIASQAFCQEQFDYDVIWGECFACHSESEAMGSTLKITESVPPSVIEPAVADYETDLGKLRLIDPLANPRLSTLLESIRRARAKHHKKVPVIGYVQAPFRHASMLRGAENTLRDIFKNKENLARLCELALYSQIVYAINVISTGADIVFLSDPTSSGDAISKKHWRDWGLVYTKPLVDIIKRSGVKTILHVCGNTTDRLEDLAETGVDCLSLDMAVDFGKAREILGPDYCLMGNLDTTMMALGKPDEIDVAARRLVLKAGKKGALLLSGGCLLADICPPENIAAMVTVGHSYMY